MTQTNQRLAGRRIAQVLATSTGGVGTHLRAIVPGLRACGAVVTVCGPPATNELFGFRAAGAAFLPAEIASGLRPAKDARALLSLRRALRGADIVHAHGLRAGLLSVLANPVCPVVVTLHNALLEPPGPRRVLSQRLERVVARNTDVVLAASLDLGDHARDIGARDVRPAPVAAPILPPPTRGRAEVRTELGVGEATPLLLAIGRLHPQKGYDTLLAASRTWRGRPGGLLVAIAGDGPLRAEMSEQINRERLPVVLLGRRDDVAELLLACDLVLLSSRWEARALVVQEALRAGRPVVATAVGGISELAGHGVGMLVPPDDPAAFAEAVVTVLQDPTRRAAMVEAGRLAAASWPTLDDTVAQLCALYEELAGSVS